MTNQTQPIWTTKTAIACLVLVVAGVALRAQFMQQGIFQDEAVTILLSLQKNPHDLIEFGRQVDYNPPMMTLGLHYLFAALGASALLAKLPSLVSWATLVPCLYVLGTICYNRKVGLLAAGCATFSEQSIFYGCIARPYSIATTLACVLLILFILSLKHAEHRRRWLVCTSITTLVFLYTHYTAPMYMIFLALSAGILWMRKQLPLIPYVVTFAIPTVLFLPWLPTMLEQSREGSPWYAGTPLTNFPFVFFSTISTFIPIWRMPAFLIAIVVAAVLVALFAFSAKFRNTAWQKIQTLGAPYLVLALCSILPCMFMGYMTPFMFGLYRYIYPFSPAGWVLLSTLLLMAYESANQRAQSSALLKRLVQGSVILLLLLVPALALIGESREISRYPLSGFRELVADIKKGELHDTLLIVAPDQDVRTFEFDYHYESSPSPSVEEHKFYRWNIEPLFNRDADSPGWLNAQTVPRFMQHITDSAPRFKYLAVTNPDYCPDSPGMPARQRLNELLEAVGKQYKLVREKYYKSGQESFHLSLYDLHSKP